jgi:phosphotransferase system enzyme I (PtsP)
VAHLRPDDRVRKAFDDSIAMLARAQERYAGLKELPARALCGTEVALHMNAGAHGGPPLARGVGRRGAWASSARSSSSSCATRCPAGRAVRLYAASWTRRAAQRVAFRTLDIGSDKV